MNVQVKDSAVVRQTLHRPRDQDHDPTQTEPPCCVHSRGKYLMSLIY